MVRSGIETDNINESKRRPNRVQGQVWLNGCDVLLGGETHEAIQKHWGDKEHPAQILDLLVPADVDCRASSRRRMDQTHSEAREENVTSQFCAVALSMKVQSQ